MQKIVLALLLAALLGVVGGAQAQSRLPPCPQTGHWHNCVGERTYPDGMKYVGEYKDNKRHGLGTSTSVSGDKYVGDWKDDRANGQGTTTMAMGHKYVGEVKDDKANGRGTFTYADGRKYVGELKDNTANGQGTLYAADGSVLQSGRWIENVLVLSQSPVVATSNPSSDVTRLKAEADAAKQRQAQAEERQRAEADAAAQRQRELENQLKLAQQQLSSQQPQQAPATPTGPVLSQTTEQRVALVIGNAAYKSSPLANPVNDARAMATRLREFGFDVILKENLRAAQMGGVYREFRSKIRPGATALVFYAGHGIQVKGQNYFPTVDAQIEAEEDVPQYSLNLGTLLENMDEAKAGVSLVFLDACRDNPYARRFRSASRGLAKVEAASGTLIHYATKPGSVAADGDGANGTYTEALLREMGTPGLQVELMLKRVTNSVVAKTKGRQEPWIEGSLRGDFYFNVKR